MNHRNFRRSRVAAAVAGSVLAFAASQSFATGFQLNENSASSIGNALAAGAAVTDDVTAMWWNPAALSQFKTKQIAGALHIITPSIKFSNDASAAAANQPLGNNGGDAGGVNFVPNMYFSMPINNEWAFGIGVNAPFGLTTEYDDGWIGRYQALKSQIKTINVNPAVSWQVTPTVALGVGLNYQQLDATLTQNVNYSGALAVAAQRAAQLGQIPASLIPSILANTGGLDSKATIKADDGAWGWNIGIAWDATPQLRLAAAYRSEMKFKPEGTVDYNNPVPPYNASTPASLAPVIQSLANAVNNTQLFGRSVSSDITLPQIANLSMVYRVNSQWEVMADAQWTGWSSIPELAFFSTPTIPAVPLEWDDTWKIALGASYRYNQQWKARFGVAFDQTPVTTHPTPRLPDSDRWWFALGGEYRHSPNLKFDAGFVYIKGDTANFNQNLGSTATYGLVNGSYDASVTIFSLQGVYYF
jgi:long-chain fatty acid transport protein